MNSLFWYSLGIFYLGGGNMILILSIFQGLFNSSVAVPLAFGIGLCMFGGIMLVITNYKDIRKPKGEKIQN